MKLTLTRNIQNPDDFYQELIDAQRDLSDDDVQLMNAKLILILANHVGDQQVVREALAAARPHSRSHE